MFDIGFSELLVIALITLVVMGPERLPETVRSIGLWIGRLRQAYAKVRHELEQEVGMDEVRHQLHNEKILRDLEDSKNELEETIDSANSAQKEITQSLRKSSQAITESNND
jgi:sec-independent protein translocase protein TatB